MPEEIDPAESTPPEWLSDTPEGDPAEHSVLRRLADANPDSGLIELATGVWWQPKQRGEMPSDRS